MTRVNCEYVRDAYPDVLHGHADSAVIEHVRAHLAECDECRADAALLETMHAQRVQPSADLHERVVRNATLRTRRGQFSRTQLALAATLAAVLIGGSAIVQFRQSQQRASLDAAEDIGFVGVDAVMMSGKTSLDDLSVEQLEQLLGEVGT